VTGRQKKDSEARSGTARSLGLGVMIPTMLFACVLVGCGLGYYADTKLGTDPWLTLFGLIMGSVAGVREMLKILKKIQKDETR
jgi:F0F1-type ATP synthase assembly protein I